MAKQKRDFPKTALAQAILNEYQTESVADMQDASVCDAFFVLEWGNTV